MPSVKLLGTRHSQFVIRARIALDLKGIKYEFVEENLRSKSDLLLKSNPVYKKVPVLIHGDHPVCESLVILQYIDEAWSTGHHILPTDAYGRAVARFWASYIDEKWFPSVRGIERAEGEERKKKLEEFSEGAALLETAFVSISKGKKFFGGERIGYLDIVAGCFLPRINAVGAVHGVKLIDEAKTPHLFKWAHAFSSDPAVKPNLPKTEELVELTKARAARPNASAQH